MEVRAGFSGTGREAAGTVTAYSWMAFCLT
jgi:hypothetical protein